MADPDNDLPQDWESPGTLAATIPIPQKTTPAIALRPPDDSFDRDAFLKVGSDTPAASAAAPTSEPDFDRDSFLNGTSSSGSLSFGGEAPLDRKSVV